jgi:hypothetical protein
MQATLRAPCSSSATFASRNGRLAGKPRAVRPSRLQPIKGGSSLLLIA